MKGIKCETCKKNIVYSFAHDTPRKKDSLLYLRQKPADKFVGVSRGALGYCPDHLPKDKLECI
jgi:hypothetical protein